MKNLPACFLALSLAACSSDRTTSGRPCNCPGDNGGDGGQAGEATGGTSPGGASPGGRGGSSGGSTEGGEAGAGEGGCAACVGDGGEGAAGGSGGLAGSAGTANAGLGGVGGSGGTAAGTGGLAGAGLGGLGGAGVGGAGSGGKAGGGVGGCLACAGSSNTAPVNLRTAGNFAVLSKSGISTVPASSVTGNLGVSPVAATYLTGWSLSLDASNQFATSTQVIGRVYAADFAPPTPAMMTTAIGDMETAFSDATSRSPGVTELGAGNISGLVITPGVYTWSSGLLLTSDVTLAGDANATFIFIVAQTLTVANGVRVDLTGGALPKNVFWAISESVSIGTSAHFEGVVMTMTSVAMLTGSSLNGRILAQTAVTLDSATVVQPTP